MRFACNLKVLLFGDVKIKTCRINYIIAFFFCNGHPFVFIKLKDNKTVPGFSQTKQFIFF